MEKENWIEKAVSISVAGAGDIRIYNDSVNVCATAVGMSISVS